MAAIYKALSFLALAALLSLSGTGRANGADQSPLELNVILPLTGSGAFLGTQEKRAIGIAETVINQRGGVRGRPVHFVFADDQTNPSITVQLTAALVAKNVPVIFGSAISAMCFAMQPLVEKNGPVEYCFSPTARGAAGSYVFSSNAGTYPNAWALVRYFREHGLKRLALITSNDATGQDFEAGLERVLALPENKSITFVDRERFNPTDLTVAAQIARIKASDPQGLVTFTTGTPMGTVLRGIQEAGLSVPTSAAAGNLVYEQILQYKDILPKVLVFAATRGIAGDPSLRAGPIKDAQTTYFRALRTAGVRPDNGTTLVWDPVMIVIDGLRALGPNASAEALRNWILNLHSWAGIGGLYDFRDGSQKGLGLNAMTVYRWDAATQSFVTVGFGTTK